jgi:type IV pilus assembly protein PilV
MMSPLPLRRPSPRHVRGFGLIDAMIALVILAFGLLAMTRFQARMITATTESQGRLTALQFSDELLTHALVDVGNVNCYTLPQTGVCPSAAAKARADEWADRAASALPGAVTTQASHNAATGRFVVRLRWTGRESNEQRTLEASTDVR